MVFLGCTKPRLLQVPEEKIPKKEIAGKIVILGSSTAVGTGASPVDSSWVKLLENKLRVVKPLISVINLSDLGFTTYHIMPDEFAPPTARPKADLDGNVTRALALKPDLVIINLPTNDVANNYNDQEIITNFERVSANLQRDSILYIITGTQPRSLSLEKRQRLKELNTKLYSVYGNSFFDYYDYLSTTDNLIQKKYSAGDGIHVNNAGHYIIFENLMKFDVFKRYLDEH